jgi:hypothetical protein
LAERRRETDSIDEERHRQAEVEGMLRLSVVQVQYVPPWEKQ